MLGSVREVGRLSPSACGARAPAVHVEIAEPQSCWDRGIRAGRKTNRRRSRSVDDALGQQVRRKNSIRLVAIGNGTEMLFGEARSRSIATDAALSSADAASLCEMSRSVGRGSREQILRGPEVTVDFKGV